MKAVPILVITNALALGLAIFLYVQQQDMKTQLSSSRTSAPRREVAADTRALNGRIEALERHLASVDAGDVPAGGMAPDLVAETAGEEPEAVDAPAGTDAPASADDEPVGGGYASAGAAMETFRKRVARAIELNEQEQRVDRVARGLDRLVEGNRIAPLNDDQKQAVARSILGTREKLPQVWRKIRGLPDGTPREERMNVARTEFEAIRAEAQQEIEGIVPAADAKVIIETQLRSPRGAMRGFGGGRNRAGAGGR